MYILYPLSAVKIAHMHTAFMLRVDVRPSV